MINSFNCKETAKIWEGKSSKKFPPKFQNIARRKLRMLNNSISIQDLRIPPLNRLERLKGRLKSYYSIRINDKYRIIFQWKTPNATKVKIIDYHE